MLSRAFTAIVQSCLEGKVPCGKSTGLLTDKETQASLLVTLSFPPFLAAPTLLAGQPGHTGAGLQYPGAGQQEHPSPHTLQAPAPRQGQQAVGSTAGRAAGCLPAGAGHCRNAPGPASPRPHSWQPCAFMSVPAQQRAAVSSSISYFQGHIFPCCWLQRPALCSCPQREPTPRSHLTT